MKRKNHGRAEDVGSLETQMRGVEDSKSSGYTNRPTPKNVGLFAFLRSIFMGLHAQAQSQTLRRAMSLRVYARSLFGAFSAFGNPTLGSLKVARPGGYRKVSNFITRTKTGKPI
jgi:hypothetical protein